LGPYRWKLVGHRTTNNYYLPIDATHLCSLTISGFYFPHESYYTAQRTYYDNYIIIVVSSGTGSHTDTHILSGMYPARTPAPSTRLDDDYADVSLNGCADDHPTGRWRRENENTTNRYCLAQRPMYKLYNTRVTLIRHDIIHILQRERELGTDLSLYIGIWSIDTYNVPTAIGRTRYAT
jgi:hypothetical protein